MRRTYVTHWVVERQAQHANANGIDVHGPVYKLITIKCGGLSSFVINEPKLQTRHPLGGTQACGQARLHTTLTYSLNGKRVTSLISNLGRFCRYVSMQPPPPAVVLSGNDEYEVDYM